MEDNEMLDLFNGTSTQNDPIKKVTLKTSDKYVKALNNAPNVSGYSSPDYSTNLEGGLKVGSENPFDVSQKEEADAESFGKQLGMTVGNTLSNVVSGTAGGIGYLGTLFEDSKGDYSNAITDWADRVRNPFGELKRKNNETIDITDSAFWLNSGQSLVESAIQFGIIAETGGLAAGAVAGKLGKVLSLGNKALKAIKGGIQGITAMELSYLEGAMSGATVYRDIYKNQYDKLISKGIPVDKANEIASKYASEGASTTVKLNTTIGTALNLTGIGSVFKTESNEALKYFTKGAGKRALNEDIKTYTNRLITQSPEMLESFTKQNYGRLLSEMTQEGIEEVVTQLAENTGRKQGEESKKSSYLGMFQDAYNNLNSVVNDEGVLNFALGAVGGAGQTVLLENVIPSQKINTLNEQGKLIPKLDDKGEVVTKNGQVQYEQTLVSPRQRDIFDNQRYYTELKDALVSDLSFIEDTQKRIETSNSKTEKEELRRKLFAVNTLDSVFKGTGINLVESYNKILETNNTDDLGIPFTKRKKEIEKEIDTIVNSVSKIDELSDEQKEQLKGLKEELIQTTKDELKNKNQTQATMLGLSKDSTDNDYKTRATKAIAEIQQIEHFYDINKDKYNLPEERNAKYAEFVTKLQSDVLGRNRILNDLTNDFVKQKADFQLFSSIEDYSKIENLLFDGKLASLLEENQTIEDKIKNHKSIDELQEIVDTLDDKVYTETEIYEKIKEKIEKNKEKIDEIEVQVQDSENFKKANKKNINDYLKSRISKYKNFKFLMDFKKELETFERNTENIKTKIKNITSDKGRNRFINNTNERIKEIKKQLEEEYAVYSYEEARRINENDYYFNKVKNIDKQEKRKIKREIKALTEEIQKLEEQANDTVTNKKLSYFSSLVNYFNKLSNIEYLIRLRKNRLNELNDYLKMLQDVKNNANQNITQSTTTSGKKKVVEAGKNQVQAINDNFEEDESLDAESGKVEEVPENPSTSLNPTDEITKYLKDNFGAISDFIASQLQLMSDNYTILDVVNTTIIKYNVTKENRVKILKDKFIDLFVKLQELNGESKENIDTFKKEIQSVLFTTEDFDEQDENLDNEAGKVEIDEEKPDIDEMRQLRLEAIEAKKKKEEEDRKAKEKEEENIQESNIKVKQLEEYIEKEFRTSALAINTIVLDMYENNSFNFNNIIGAVLNHYNITDPKQIYQLKNKIIGLEPYIISLQGLEKKTIANIKKQIKAIKKDNIFEEIEEVEEVDEDTVEEEEITELPTAISQTYGTSNEEKTEREEILPFTLDVFRIQYGDLTKDDNKKAFNIKVGSNVTLQVDKDNLFSFGYTNQLDAPISIILEGVKVGYLPTLAFIEKTYIKNNEHLTKLYFPSNFSNIDIKTEFEDIQSQVNSLGLYPDIIKKESILGEEVFTVDFYEFNKQKITKIRREFINHDNILKTTIKRKSGGRAVTSNLKDLTEFAKLDSKRIKLHNVSSKGLYPVVPKLKKSSFNYKKSNVLAVISYPNAIGERNIYPVVIDKLNNDDVQSVKYLFNLFVSANNKNKEALNELTTIYEKLGFNTNGSNPLYVFNDFLDKYYTNISNFSTKTSEIDIPVLYYHKKNQIGKDTNDFEIKINKKDKNGKIREETYRLNNPKQTEAFLKELDLFKNKLFTLDSNKLENINDNANYPVFQNGKIIAKNMSYFNYIKNKVKTKLDINEDRRDDKGNIIYVQDYVLTLNDNFTVENTTPVTQNENIVEPESIPSKINNTRRKVQPLNPDSKILFNLPNNTITDRIGDINNPIFVQQFIDSNIEYKVFLGNFIQTSVLNDTYSDSQKLEIFNEALQVKSLDDVNKIFHKICIK